jgi:Na+-translocating ferredoxin:NAD+ oxidoreductase RnfG subunit
MIRTHLILFVFVLLLAPKPAGAQVARKNEVVSLKDGLKEMLQQHGAASMKKVSVTVDATKAKALSDTHGVSAEGVYTVYQGVAEDKSVIGTVVIVNEEGKEGPLQVLVALKPDGKIYDVGFTIFGEDKGKSALNWGFLKQFLDRQSGDAFSLGSDVDGISGATWTSESVTHAVERAAVVFAEFLK